MERPQSEPHITRIERGTTKYWWARMTIDGRRTTKAFFDSTYGGTELAKEAARAWLEQAKAAYRRQRAIDSRNTSGVKGVHRGLRGGRAYWIASFYVQKRKRKEWLFPVSRLGEEEAFRQAVAKRQAMEALYALDRQDVVADAE